MGDESAWATCPQRATATISSSPARREGRGEGVGSGERPPSGHFLRELEAGRGEKPGGIKRARGASTRRSWSVGGGLGLGGAVSRWRYRSVELWSAAFEPGVPAVGGGAGEGPSRVAQTSHHEGGGNLRGLWEFFRSTKLLGHKGLRVQSDPLVFEGVFPCFSLCESCGAVSR